MKLYPADATWCSAKFDYLILSVQRPRLLIENAEVLGVTLIQSRKHIIICPLER
jgi:hypothetical protein